MLIVILIFLLLFCRFLRLSLNINTIITTTIATSYIVNNTIPFTLPLVDALQEISLPPANQSLNEFCKKSSISSSYPVGWMTYIYQGKLIQYCE